MKHFRSLVVLAQAALFAGGVNAGTLMLNGNNCGTTTQEVTISTNGDVTVSTNGTCVPGGGGGGPVPFALTVTRSGTGSGTVSSSVGDINCGSTCSANYAADASVILTATPAEGSVFAGWSNGCTGTGTCTVNANSSSTQSRNAIFNLAGGTTTCPSGVTCVERPWPTIAQETFSLRSNGILAIKVNTTEAGLNGYLDTMNTTGNTATRDVYLSTQPGVFPSSLPSPPPRRTNEARCYQQGFETTTTAWEQSGTDSVCQIPANSPMWINIKFTNCTSSSCSFYLKNN